ncbi:MAG: ABC transporter ATP-binding protein [Solirubrobacteraceae bacterium]
MARQHQPQPHSRGHSPLSALHALGAARAGKRSLSIEQPLPEARVGADVVVTGVVKSFGRVEALRGVSLSVAPAEFVTITGPSGSGKSTLLSLIGSLDRPDSGSIVVDGRPVPDPRDAVEFRRREVGFVFQDNLLLSYLTAQANIEAALMATGVGHKERRLRSFALLQEVGLVDRADHIPSQLSGGQRQAVALARALANEPSVLLADEPTGALDTVSGARALDLLAALRERHGMTVIVVSHDITVAERADRVLRLVDGRVADE